MGKWSRKRHDRQTLKLYDAEHGEQCSYILPSQRAVFWFVRGILRSPVWRRLAPGLTNVDIVFRSTGTMYNYARYQGNHSSLILNGGRFGRDVHGIVHEMAHLAAEHKRGNATRQSSHDYLFIRYALPLYRAFTGTHYARRIERAYKRTGATHHRRGAI